MNLYIFLISLEFLSLENPEILMARVEALVILGEHLHGVASCFITEIFTFVLSFLNNISEKAIIPIFLGEFIGFYLEALIVHILPSPVLQVNCNFFLRAVIA